MNPLTISISVLCMAAAGISTKPIGNRDAIDFAAIPSDTNVSPSNFQEMKNQTNCQKSNGQCDTLGEFLNPQCYTSKKRLICFCADIFGEKLVGSDTFQLGEKTCDKGIIPNSKNFDFYFDPEYNNPDGILLVTHELKQMIGSLNGTIGNIDLDRSKDGLHLKVNITRISSEIIAKADKLETMIQHRLLDLANPTVDSSMFILALALGVIGGAVVFSIIGFVLWKYCCNKAKENPEENPKQENNQGSELQEIKTRVNMK